MRPHAASAYLEKAVDLDGSVERQRSYPNGSAGVRSDLVAEHLCDQIRGAVGHNMLLSETRRRGDEGAKAHHRPNAPQIALAGLAHLSDQVDGANPGGSLPSSASRSFGWVMERYPCHERDGPSVGRRACAGNRAL